MKSIGILILTFSICLIARGQDLRYLSKNSYYTYIYQVPADSIYRLNDEKDDYSYDPALPHFKLIDSFPSTVIYDKKLPVGYYFYVKVEDRKIKTKGLCVTNLIATILADHHRNKLIIRTKTGETITDATVAYRKRKIRYNRQAEAYVLPFSTEDGRMLTIEARGEKICYGYSTDEKEKEDRDDRKERRQKEKASRSAKSNGYIVFNKPKYLPGDTVRLKAYLLHKSNSAYKTPLQVRVNKRYTYDREQDYMILADHLYPVTPGAYVFEFIITDSFQIDRSYDLSFAEPSGGQSIIEESFRVEDYLLDKYTYEFTVDKKNWNIPIGDTIRMTATAKDQTGMNAMDSRVRITAIANGVSDWYSDYECVPDTLFVMERRLSATGATRFYYPLEWGPDVRMNISLQADFINSAYEHQYKSEYIEIDRRVRRMEVQQFVDSVFADVMVSGHPVSATGWVDATGSDGEILYSRPVRYPLQMRIDAYVSSYTFRAYGQDTLTQSFQPGGYPFMRYFRTDSTIIFYPDRSGSPLYYTLYHGPVVIRQGALTTHPDTIQDRTRREYKVLVQSIGRGNAGYMEYAIGVGSNQLSVTVAQSEVVYPGKSDTVSIHVTDIKGHPVSAANVTAVSYNDKFGSIHINTGGRARYADHPEMRESELESMEDVGLDTDLGACPYWIGRMHLDTMPYYQLVFAGQRIHAHFTPATGLGAQFAPFVFDHGRAVRIHMIYVDGTVAWYEGAEGVMPYAIPVSAGRHDIRLRTTDRMVHLGDIYLHEGVKTDLIMEWDSIRTGADTLPAELTSSEKEMLRQKFIYYKQQRYDDTAYFWQEGSRYVFGISPYYQGTGSSTRLLIPIGPLGYGKTDFYVPHKFTTSFDPERMYAYSFSPGLARLESVDPFAVAYIPLREYASPPVLRFGELLSPHPVPDLSMRSYSSSLYHGQYMFGRRYTSTYLSALSVSVHSDSTVSYVRLYRTDSLVYDELYNYDPGSSIAALRPGRYELMAITASGYCYIYRGIDIPSYSNCHITLHADTFAAPQTWQTLMSGRNTQTTKWMDSALLYIPTPDREGIMGRVYDSTGAGLQTVHVTLWDTIGHPVGRSTITDRNGYFYYPALKPGSYIIALQYSGYQDRIARNVFCVPGRTTFLSVRMRPNKTIPFSKNALKEVTVTAYHQPLIDRADTKIESVVSSYERVVAASDLSSVIARTPGVLISNRNEDEEVQYLVNGHRVIGKMNESVSVSVENLASTTAGVTQIDVPKASLSAKYGDLKEVDVDLNEKYKDAPKLRSNFRDYAYWEPNLITDDNGEAKFVARYPDNIATWRSYAIAMNARHRFGGKMLQTRSFKECSAEMAVPQFLIAGDSSTAAVKISNYLQRSVPLRASFIWDGKKTQENDVTVNDILTDEVHIVVSPDEKRKEVKTSFNISTPRGFGDGEEKAIAILPQGTEETKGVFALLRGDTSLTLPIDPSLGQVTVRAESDILDVLIDEAEHVRKYPYWCMEQTASRLVMLAMMEQISTTLGKSFKYEKEKKTYISKLQKGQLVNGAYGWWEYSPASVRITTYVLSALGKAGVNTEVNTKDAYAYLDASLDLMSREEKLNTLELYAERKWQPYRVMSVLHKLPFDSLTLHQQMQYYKAELLTGDADTFHHWDRILAKREQTIFGGSYWGEDSWFWYNNQTSATVLAYELAVLRKDNALQEQIIQYFLEKRGHNGWRNTAESAKIVSAILPKVLADRKGDLSSPSLGIDGQGIIAAFPYQAAFTPSSQSLRVTKRGGGPVYFTAYQHVFNPSPQAVSKDFDVNTTFKKNDKPITSLTSGESSEIAVDITTRKYSEYLMIEIPIPAGCTYGTKLQGYGNGEVHREYFKDKVVIFCESFRPGHQEFHIPIESRYKGSYTVNPAKVQLMYFPTFFGRTGMKRVSIH